MKSSLTLISLILLIVGMISIPSASAQTRLPVAQVGNDTRAVALETYRGQQYSVRQVALPRTNNVKDMLSSHQIEFSTGEIIYPHEVEYVIIIDARPPREIEHTVNSLKRMPREFE